MNRVSFKANLVVNPNLYNDMPSETPEDYTEQLVSGYKRFLNHKVIKHVTDGDTIEISRKAYDEGFAINMRFTSPELEEPLDIGIHTNKEKPTITVEKLVRWTKMFIIKRENITRKSLLETELGMYERAIAEHYEKEKK